VTAPRLFVTATALEAAPLHDAFAWEELPSRYGELWRAGELYLAHLGVGKVNTAAGLALLLERLSPRDVIQFGIGGAYVGAFLSVGMVAIAAREIHLDSGVKTAEGWFDMRELGFPLVMGEQPLYNLIPTDQRLSHALVDATGAPLVTFGTSETVTGSFDDAGSLQARFDLSVESMEGAAAAQVCYAMGVPFAELRGISNIVGERDKRAWDIPAAIRAVNRAVLGFLKSA
jgi:futalosine hydrolase